MKNFAFRVTSLYDVTVEHLAPLYELCEKVAVYEHSQATKTARSRTHIHGVLIGCKKGEDTLRNRFFKGKYESADYELKTKYEVKVGIMKVKRKYDVDEKYVTYMSKGVLDPMFFKGFTQEEIDAYKAQWIAHTPEVVEVSDKPESKAKPKNMYEECQEIVAAKLPSRHVPYMGGFTHVAVWDYSDDEIVDAIVLWANEHHKAINQYKVRDYYDCILMRQKPMRYRDAVLHLIQKRNSP